MNSKKGAECPAQERIASLVDEGSEVCVNHTVKAAAYVRSGRELFRSANNYLEDGLLEHALVLYTRIIAIFLKPLRDHPGFKTLPPEDKKTMKTLCNQAFPKAEDIREKLRQKFEKEHEEYLNQLTKVANQTGGGTPSSQASITQGNYNEESKREVAWKLDPNWQHNKDHGQGQIEIQAPPAPSAPYADIVLERLPGQLPEPQHLPAFDRNSKPNRFMSPMSSGLREVIIPGDLIPVFLKCAEKNTDNNVETCGFLTGRILGGRLVITDLIIPKQDGTSDSCTAKGDVEYLLIQDNLDLITFGWIHTHPSQTAFLSSVDMHSQYCYQQMMPEALAIVCAPRKNQVGTFTLNPAEGMDMIGNCPHTSGFHTHPHTSEPLFIDATHHTFDKTRNVSVHDLRYT